MADSPFLEFKQELQDRGLEQFGRYYGTYRGQCADATDPDVLGRIKLRCPSVWGEGTPDIWAWPIGMPAGAGYGFFWVPAPDETVYVRFEGGDPAFPLWEHGWYPRGKAPKGAGPNVRILQSSSGHRVELNDDNGKLTFTNAAGYVVSLDRDGVLITKGGKSVGQLAAEELRAIQQLTVLTPLGVSSVPVNAPVFAQIAVELAQIFK